MRIPKRTLSFLMVVTVTAGVGQVALLRIGMIPSSSVLEYHAKSKFSVLGYKGVTKSSLVLSLEFAFMV